ncbi:MAG: hypothetical protein LZ172_03470 [Thaumarchaeota archaeon]|jgi:predicted hydrocarbon binding protein|nr:hypothetical protein [Candidatus Geocrenenecus arthurdayi]MCL7402501.1 hypothetical protein [Candidatus Geocrenenecus arthurdayi]MCL7403391.1 hypothetical protein [Candidatus Geocrenenecus arthurdayi]
MSAFRREISCDSKFITNVSELIRLMLASVRYNLGIGLCSVLLYNLGKNIGEDLYNSYLSLKSGEASLEEASEHLINCLKTHDIVKDALILKAFKPEGRLELICKINSKEIENISGDDSDTKISLVYFFYRGILSRYYELFFKAPLNIKKISILSDEAMICEFILETPLEDRVNEP